MSNRNPNRSNLGEYEMLNRGFDEENDAQRVVIVADAGIKIEVDNSDLKESNDRIIKALDELVIESRKEQPELLPQIVMVPKIEIREIEKQVIVKEPQIIEIEKRVEVPVYKTIEVPIFMDKIVQVPVPIIEKQRELTGRLDKIALILQSLIILGFLINILK